MKRVQIYLSEKEQADLKKEAMRIDISFSELIRRVLDEYIEKNKLGGRR